MNFSAQHRELARPSAAIKSRRRAVSPWISWVSWVSSVVLAGNAPAVEPLPGLLEKLCAQYELPALAAAAVKGLKITESAAVGVRQLGGAGKVTLEDRWHIGSCTKSMTATLAAMLIEQGRLKWSTTIGETFPELSRTGDPQWAGVTLDQLLTHRSGAPAEPPANLSRNAFAQHGTPSEQRLEFVKGLMLRRPESTPGTTFTYSNQGYAIAGAMLERVTGEPWEKLMTTMLFPACVMPNAGFGAPASPGRTDQPWGHRRDGDKLVPVPPGRNADNPPAIGPAGAVHCTIAELARYAAWHGRGERTGTATLKRESFVKLHTPLPGGDYAMGWAVAPRGWAGGNALTHAGSNTMFFAVIWIAPSRDTAFVAATNCAGEKAAKACDEAVAALIARSAE